MSNVAQVIVTVIVDVINNPTTFSGQVLKTETPQLKSRSKAAIAGEAAVRNLIASGVTDRKAIELERLRAYKEAQRRLSGKKKINRMSVRAVAARKRVAELMASGITDNVVLVAAYKRTYEANMSEAQRATVRRNERARYKRNAQKERLRSQARRRSNPKYHTDYTRKRRASDQTFDLICRLRHSTNMHLGQHKAGTTTVELLGCSQRFFSRWIESQFQPGMSWDNRSKWHLEHVFPVSACASIDDIKKSFFYRNIRPEWGVLNCSKGRNITPDSIVCATLCGIQTIALSSDWQMPKKLILSAIRLNFKVNVKCQTGS